LPAFRAIRNILQTKQRPWAYYALYCGNIQIFSAAFHAIRNILQHSNSHGNIKRYVTETFIFLAAFRAFPKYSATQQQQWKY
jgi:hypothetical protein